MGTALVSETFGFASRLTGSLAGTWFEVVAVETYVARRRGAALRARIARRVAGIMVAGGSQLLFHAVVMMVEVELVEFQCQDVVR